MSSMIDKVLFSTQHAEKTHMSSKVDFKSRTLFSTNTNSSICKFTSSLSQEIERPP